MLKSARSKRAVCPRPAADPPLRPRLRSAAFLIVLLLAGCADREAERAGAASVTFETVANLEASPDGTFAWKLVEDLRLGAGPSGPLEQQFGSVPAIATDSRGRIYVMDGRAQHIRVFDASGKYLHTIGREGSGPGEFTGVKTMVVGPDDRLWVIDDGEMRYSIFGPDGQLLETFRRDVPGFVSASGAVLPDGSFIDWAPYTPDGRFGRRFFFVPLRLSPPDYRPDSLPPLQHAWKMIRGGTYPVIRFAGAITAAVDASGSIWFAITSNYEVYRRTLAGDTTLAFRLDATAPALGEAERDHIRETFRPELAAEYVDALPERKPIIERIVPDNAGHVLVAVDIANRQRGTVIDVFQETGKYVGRLELPTPMSMSMSGPKPHATSDHLYIVARDDLDVPYVVRFRIDRTGSPGA